MFRRPPIWKIRGRIRALAMVTLGSATALGAAPVAAEGTYALSSEEVAFLEQLQRDTFLFFWETTSATNGLTLDRFPANDISSVAGIGFALTSYVVAVNKGWITRAEAAERTQTTLRFLWKAPQSPAPTAIAGYRGFFYHFLDMKTGHRAPGSELSTVDTALLMAGVLSSAEFFDGPSSVERSIRRLARQLYERVDWPWAYSRRQPPLLSMGWTPEDGFIAADWQGYNEAMILYVLALGSKTHPIKPAAWNAWASTYRWEESDGFPRVAFDPLFGHQYSHVWIDFRGIQDAYMRGKGIDYFVNSTRATYANRAYCVANPAQWVGYDEQVWGLTASDGPLKVGAEADVDNRFHAYWARGAGPDRRDDGTIAVTAAGGSVPFAPELAIPTLRYFHSRFGAQLYGKYGFKDAFNLSFPNAPSREPGWFADQYVAIDQGPILLMIENFRSGSIWTLMKKNASIRAGLRRAGFTGGWLDGKPTAAATDRLASTTSEVRKP